MKKTLLATICALGALASPPAAAQYYLLPNPNLGHNPGRLNTDDEQLFGSVAGWNMLVTGDVNTQATPVWSAVQTLPFTFQFNGQAVNSYKVSTSGVLTFTTSAPTAPPTYNTALPAALIPDNSICIWGTLMVDNSDFLLKKTFGTAPYRQHWVQFNSVTLPFPTGTSGSPIVASYLYCAIVLEETTNRVYLVWQRSSSQPQTLTAGIQLNATTAVQVAASPNLTLPNLVNTTAADNVYYEFGAGTPPPRDLSLEVLDVPSVTSRQQALPIAGTLLNQGSQAVTSYSVHYKVNNGATVTGAVSGANVAAAARARFAHPTPWVPSTNGTYNLKVWLSNPNGQPDQNPTNDTLRATVQVQEDSLRRYVVEECFTSSTCPPCVAGNVNVENINRDYKGKQVVIKYQQNFPSPGNDPYYTAESGSRRGFYGINAIPYMTLDGGWNQNSQSFSAGILAQYHNVPVTMRVQGNYSLTRGQVVTASAAIRPFQAYAAGQLVAHLVITERHTTRNARTNGETDFYQVMKKMLPNQNGTALPALAAGQAFTFSQTFDVSTLPASQAVEHFDSLRVVVFVQDVVSKVIYQGGYLTLLNPLAARTTQTGPAFSLYPNPASGRTLLVLGLNRAQTVRVEVLDGLGRAVLALAPRPLGPGPQELLLDLAHQAPGLYTVRLTSEEGVRTSKLTLE